jgi:hypothetical protein
MRKLLLACVGLVVVSAPAAAQNAAQAEIRRVDVHFAKGASSAKLAGTIKGSQIVDYVLRGRSGQSMTVAFEPSNLSAYFNVLPPGSQEALFVGSTSGNQFDGALPVDGDYTIRVYLMRNAARRNETAKYKLEVGMRGPATKAATAAAGMVSAGAAFDRVLELHGITFRVTSANSDGANVVRIVPQGLEIDNSPIERRINGVVTGAEVGDLNVDRSPEVYVYVREPGSAARSVLVAYAANRRKSLSEIYLAPVAENPALSKGYRGHDEFALVENVLAQRFPIYRNGDTDNKSTGGMRQLQYKLVPGEAGWVLKLGRKVEF